MRTLKHFLPDVNVWLALAYGRHIHSRICAEWLNAVESGPVSFCRVSQMGLLRLLTNEKVMGKDVLSSKDAWDVYQAILVDERMTFAGEPFGMEQAWQKLTSHNKPAPNVWTDAYLAAFAQSSSMRVVTLDKAFSSSAHDALLLK